MVVPLPSWPPVLMPQHFADWSGARAQTCWMPAERLTVEVSAVTSRGVVALLVVGSPMPSSPSWLRPQHLTAPAVVRAQEWLPPAATEAALVRPVTDTGKLRLTVAPLPS